MPGFIKERKKQEEKEKHKLEREKKKEREKEMQRKVEARAQKAAAEKAKKQAEKEKNVREKIAERLKKTQEKAARVPATHKRARSIASSTKERALDKEPRSKAPKTTDDTIDFDKCCHAACFGLYVHDAGADREWIECSYSRWIHEECVENVIHDANGKELLCPVCLSLV